MEFFKTLPLGKDAKDLIENLEKINNIRNKYIHPKTINNPNYKEVAKKDAKEAIGYMLVILKEYRPATRLGAVGYSGPIDKPSSVLKLFY